LNAVAFAKLPVIFQREIERCNFFFSSLIRFNFCILGFGLCAKAEFTQAIIFAKRHMKLRVKVPTKSAPENHPWKCTPISPPIYPWICHKNAWIRMNIQWKGINCKQSTMWQHLSRLKASAFFSLQKNFVVMKNSILYLGLVMPSGGWQSLKNTIHKFNKCKLWTFSQWATLN